MKRSLKLLSIGHSYVVSLNRRLAYEISILGKDKWSVSVIAPTHFYGHRDLSSQRLMSLEKTPYDLIPLKAYLTCFPHLFYYDLKLRQLMNYDWDLIHCWEEPFVFAGYQVALLKRPSQPLIFHTAQNIQKLYPVPFNWIEQYTMSRASGWISCGHTIVQTLREKKEYQNRPVRLIPLGVDTEVFFPNPRAKKIICEKLAWKESGPPTVGFLGRFVPEKGLGFLMKVLDKLQTPWRALIVGGGDMEGVLRSWAGRHRNNIRILTHVKHDEVPHYLNAIDILCAPSQTTRLWREQFGRMVIEAFACGIPVVGSDSGEIPYVIGDAGLILQENDEAAWVDKLSFLLENPLKRQRLGLNGRERVESMFAWNIIARKYLNFFDDIVN